MRQSFSVVSFCSILDGDGQMPRFRLQALELALKPQGKHTDAYTYTLRNKGKGKGSLLVEYTAAWAI